MHYAYYIIILLYIILSYLLLVVLNVMNISRIFNIKFDLNFYRRVRLNMLRANCALCLLHCMSYLVSSCFCLAMSYPVCQRFECWQIIPPWWGDKRLLWRRQCKISTSALCPSCDKSPKHHHILPSFFFVFSGSAVCRDCHNGITFFELHWTIYHPLHHFAHPLEKRARS